MIQKIILVILLSFTSLFSADIVGKWQMNMPASQKANPLEKMEESKQFVVMMFASAWNDVAFAANGTFDLPKAKQKGIWKKQGDIYIVQSSKKAPENKLTMLDDSHMKIVFDDPKIGLMTFYFLRFIK